MFLVVQRGLHWFFCYSLADYIKLRQCELLWSIRWRDYSAARYCTLRVITTVSGNCDILRLIQDQCDALPVTPFRVCFWVCGSVISFKWVSKWGLNWGHIWKSSLVSQQNLTYCTHTCISNTWSNIFQWKMNARDNISMLRCCLRRRPNWNKSVIFSVIIITSYIESGSKNRD